MKSFADFNIKPVSKGFEGDKIKIDRILNKLIIVEQFKIEASKYEKGNGKCLYMQINFDNSKRLVFSGSAKLMELILQVPEDGFPFSTTITKENDTYKFT